MEILPLLLQVFFLCHIATCSQVSPCTFHEMNDTATLDCSGRNLTRIPNQHQSYKTEVLHLQFNLIETLPNHGFQSYKFTLELDLRGNRINSIGNEAFVGLSRLVKLDLSMNRINILPLNGINDNLARLSISMNALHEIPEGISSLDNLKTLDLSSNFFLTEIKKDSLPKNLISLNMQHTGVKHFSRSAFSRLKALKTLILSDNMASSALSFEKNVFSDLHSLEYLDLSRSFCKYLNGDFLKNLTKLETVLLDNCWLEKIPLFSENQVEGQVTGRLVSREHKSKRRKRLLQNRLTREWFNPDLKVLDLSNNRRITIQTTLPFPSSLMELRMRNIRLPKITDTMFGNMISLRIIDIRQTKLKEINADAFVNLKNATQIRLSKNPLQVLPKFPKSLTSLDVCNTKVIALTRKMLSGLRFVTRGNFSNGEIKKIEDNAFRDLTSVESLDISANQISTIRRHTLSISTNSNLLTLNLSSNSLRVISKGSFASHVRLHTLDLQENSLKTLKSGIFSGIQNLVTLKLNGNRLSKIDIWAFEMLTKLEILHLQDNNIELLFSETFENLLNLKELQLQRNSIAFLDEISLPSLSYLDISQNGMLTFPEITAESLKHIEASNNEITSIDYGSLKRTYALEYLNLEHCFISFFNYSVFSETPALRNLLLSDNFIEYFVDVELPLLETLAMGENQIQSIPTHLHQILPNIKSLDLRFNSVQQLNVSVFSGISNLSRLDLSGNNFVCTCGLYPFVEWMKAHIDLIVDADLYQCEEPPEEYAMPVMDVVNSLQCTTSVLDSDISRGKYVVAAVAVGMFLAFLCLLLFYVLKRPKIFQRRKHRENNNQDKSGDSAETSDNSCIPCKTHICREEER